MSARPEFTRSPARVGARWVVPLYVLTTPGVVLHELAHQFVAELFGLEVREVDYTSHVVHEAPRTITQAVLVAVAPLVVNTTFAVGAVYALAGGVPLDLATLDLGWTDPGAAATSGVPYVVAAVEERWLDALAAYLVFSLLFRAVPSMRDVGNVFVTARRLFSWSRPGVLLLFLLLAPVLVPLYAGLWLARATGTRVAVDLGYAVVVVALLLGLTAPVGGLPVP